MPKANVQSGSIDLFGNPRLSPRQLMQQQLAELMQETAARTVNADPRTQGVSLFGSAVGGLAGQALVNAGVLPKPPEVERAEKLEKARAAIKEDADKQGIDPVSNPTGFADLAASHFLRAGDEQSAMMAIQWRQMHEANQRVAEKERQGIAASRAAEVAHLKEYTPESVEQFRQTNDASKLVLTAEAMEKGRGSYLQAMTDQNGRLLYLDTRAKPGQAALYYADTGQPVKTPTTKGSESPDLQRKLAEGRELGKQTGGAKFDLPTAETNAELALKHLDAALADPALKKATGGFMGRLPALFGEQARGVARIDQLKGGAFLTAYQQLKGGGHITEVEGQKGQEAIARLNRAQTHDDFVEALNDLRAVIISGRERARRQAGVATEVKPDAKRTRESILKQYGL